MARLSSRDWKAARALWETDPYISAADIGRGFGVSRQAVRKKIMNQGWVKAHRAWLISRYQKQYSELLISFFTRDIDQIKRVADASGLDDQFLVNAIIPMIQDFAESIGTTTGMLRVWAKKIDAFGAPLHPEFGNACKRARDLQLKLINKCVALSICDVQFAAVMVANPDTLLGWDENSLPSDRDGFALLFDKNGELDARCVQSRWQDEKSWPKAH